MVDWKTKLEEEKLKRQKVLKGEIINVDNKDKAVFIPMNELQNDKRIEYFLRLYGFKKQNDGYYYYLNYDFSLPRKIIKELDEFFDIELILQGVLGILSYLEE